MTLEQMLQRAMGRQQIIVDRARNEGQRSINEEEKREFDEIQSEINTLRSLLNANSNAGTLITPNNPQNNPQEDGARQAAEQERLRMLEIEDMCRALQVEEETIRTYIKEGKTVDEVRKLVMDKMIQNGAPVHVRAQQETGEDSFRDDVSTALLLRAGIDVKDASAGAQNLKAMGLRDIAIECLTRENAGGQLNTRSQDELFTMLTRDYYNPTAAFPSIMDLAINKSYKAGYERVPVTFDKWVAKGSLKDFKAQDNYYVAGTAGEFYELPENGELKQDVPQDVKLPSRKLKTFGRQFTMSRTAFINDDIGYITTLPQRYAASAKKTQNTQVYRALTQNPVIYDGSQLFSAAHNNVIEVGTDFTVQAAQKIIMMMQLQKDQFGEAIIIRPAHWVVPVGYAFKIQSVLWSQTINTADNTQAFNPLYAYRNSIDVVEDPTLNALIGENSPMPWFLVADSNDAPTIQIDYLNGQETPSIRRMERPGTLGFVWDIYLDWGITVVDYRGIVKNNGIKLNL